MSDLAKLAKKAARRLARGNEAVDQAALAYWVRSHQTTYPELRNFLHVPLEAGRDADPKGRGAFLRAAKMKRHGVEHGYPDNLLDVARGGWHGLRLELKKRGDWNDRTGSPYARGEPREDQQAWHARLAAQGYCVWIAWGWEAGRDVLLWYLQLPKHGFAVGDPRLTPGTNINRTRHILL